VWPQKVSKVFPYNSRCSRFHALADPPEGGGRLGWPASYHVAGNSQNDIDAKKAQLAGRRRQVRRKRPSMRQMDR